MIALFIFLLVPEEGDGESDGASDGEGGRRSRRGSTDSRGTPNRLPTFSRKLLDAGKRMGRRASTMIDQGLLLKSDKLAHLEKLAAKSSTFSDDTPKVVASMPNSRTLFVTKVKNSMSNRYLRAPSTSRLR